MAGTKHTSKKRKQAPVDEEPPSQNKTLFEKEDTTDVTVVVGGVEFKEHSVVLRSWSDYFEGAFRSGMKETEHKRFEFPDRDPEEWKLLKRLLDPFDGEIQINESNVDNFLPWFSELIVPKGMRSCDALLKKRLSNKLNEKAVFDLDECLYLYAKGIEYNLRKTKKGYAKLLDATLIVPDCRSIWEKPMLAKLCNLIATYEECREDFWLHLEKFLPKPIFDRSQQDALLATGVLEELMYRIMQDKAHTERLTKALDDDDELDRATCIQLEIALLRGK